MSGLRNCRAISAVLRLQDLFVARISAVLRMQDCPGAVFQYYL